MWPTSMGIDRSDGWRFWSGAGPGLACPLIDQARGWRSREKRSGGALPNNSRCYRRFTARDSEAEERESRLQPLRYDRSAEGSVDDLLRGDIASGGNHGPDLAVHRSCPCPPATPSTAAPTARPATASRGLSNSRWAHSRFTVQHGDLCCRTGSFRRRSVESLQNAREFAFPGRKSPLRIHTGLTVALRLAA